MLVSRSRTVDLMVYGPDDEEENITFEINKEADNKEYFRKQRSRFFHCEFAAVIGHTVVELKDSDQFDQLQNEHELQAIKTGKSQTLRAKNNRTKKIGGYVGSEYKKLNCETNELTIK